MDPFPALITGNYDIIIMALTIKTTLAESLGLSFHIALLAKVEIMRPFIRFALTTLNALNARLTFEWNINKIAIKTWQSLSFIGV